MPPIPLADNFLAGSIISLLMPVGLLIALLVWHAVAARRVPHDTPASSATLPPAEVLAAADPNVEDPPAEPPAHDEF